MDFNLSPQEEAFRDELRAWLKKHVPKGWESKRGATRTDAGYIAFLKDWAREMQAGGWAGVSWPLRLRMATNSLRYRSKPGKSMASTTRLSTAFMVSAPAGGAGSGRLALLLPLMRFPGLDRSALHSRQPLTAPG